MYCTFKTKIFFNAVFDLTRNSSFNEASIILFSGDQLNSYHKKNNCSFNLNTQLTHEFESIFVESHIPFLLILLLSMLPFKKSKYTHSKFTLRQIINKLELKFIIQIVNFI